MKILFLSHTADGGYFKVGSHHLARELARRGHNVAHLSTSHSWAHKIPGLAKRHMQSNTRETRIDSEGVVHIVPQTIFPVQLCSAKRRISHILESVHFRNPDVLLVDQPLFADLISLFGPRTIVIYRPTDQYPSGLTNRRQTHILETADAIVATSEPVLRELTTTGYANIPGIVIENGVELSCFDVHNNGPRHGFVYVGALDDRFDWTVIQKIAHQIGEESIHLYGPLPDSKPKLPDNVYLHGPIPYSMLPTMLSKYKVGLLPLSDSILNAGRSPMKYYEYLASGLFVLARDTPELRRRTAAGVYLYGGSENIAEALLKISATVAPNVQGKKESAQFDWDRVCDRLVAFVESVRK